MPPYDTLYDATGPDAPGNPERLARQKESSPQHKANPLMRFMESRDLRKRIAQYAGAISWTDHIVGELEQQLAPSTVLLIASDHGESLDEHLYWMNHGSKVYQASIRVPIILRAPGLSPTGLSVDVPVSTKDIAPTVLKLAGLSTTAATLLDRVHSPELELVSYASRQESRITFDIRRDFRVAFRQGDTKWIVAASGALEHYNLTDDPNEVDDLSGLVPPSEAEPIIQRGLDLIGELKTILEKPSMTPSLDTLEALHALGYVE